MFFVFNNKKDGGNYMTEKNEQSPEAQERTESVQESAQTEKTVEADDTTKTAQIKRTETSVKEPHKFAWFKKISKQTIIAAVLFFVLGGVTASVVNNLTHSKKNEAEMMSNKGFPERKGNGEEGQPGMRSKQGTFNEDEAPDATGGASKSENNNNGTDTSTDESNNTKSQSNA